MSQVAIPAPGRCRGRPAGKLTDKQSVWIAEYVKDCNGARAAAAAGFRHPSVAAAKLLNPDRYPHVVAEVRRRLAEKRAACMTEARQLVEELAKIAFFNPKTLFSDDGKPIPLHELPDDVAGAVAKWDVKESVDADGARVRAFHYRGHNKPAALRLMALLLGHRPARFGAPPADDASAPELTGAGLREAIRDLVRAAAQVEAADGAPAEYVSPLL